MHIKFINRGKGSAHKASAYVVDQKDLNGIVRAGVDVLRGDAQTFNAICDSSPHLWKYTSGVIAWSKEDAPTDEHIQEVLNEFESHAFAGLDKDQYHLLAVQHTDQDGSKHIHVLVPRIDLQSGKSLNIAPPNHHKYFDPLRDYFNAKYEWSRPDDLLLSREIQEPHHIAKINAQAKRVFESEDLGNLTNKQFRQTIHNYLTTLLKTQEVENRIDIVQELKTLSEIEKVEEHENYLTITRSSNSQKLRLKGDFYNEEFEIGAYAEHLREESSRRTAPSELRKVIRELEQLKNNVRAEREIYNQRYINSKRKFEDNNDLNQLIANLTSSQFNNQPNQHTKSRTKEFRYIANIDNTGKIQQLVFNSRNPTNENKYSNIEFQPRPSTNQQSIRERDGQSIERKRNGYKFLLYVRTDNQRGTLSIAHTVSSPRTNHFHFHIHDRKPNPLIGDSLDEVRNKSLHGNASPIIERRNRNSEEIERITETGKQIAARTKRLIDRSEQTINRSLADLQRSEQTIKSSLRQMHRIERTVQNQLRGNHTESNQQNEFFIAFERFNTSTCVLLNHKIGSTNRPESTSTNQQQDRTVNSGIKGINISSIVNRVQGNFNTGFEQSNNAIRAFSQTTNRLTEQVDQLNKDIELNGLKINIMPIFNRLNNRHRQNPYFENFFPFQSIDWFKTSQETKLEGSNFESPSEMFKSILSKVGSIKTISHNADDLLKYGNSNGIFLNKDDLTDIKKLCNIIKIELDFIKNKDFSKFIEFYRENKFSESRYSNKSKKEIEIEIEDDEAMYKKNWFVEPTVILENLLDDVNQRVQEYEPFEELKRQQSYIREQQQRHEQKNDRGYDSPTPSF